MRTLNYFVLHVVVQLIAMMANFRLEVNERMNKFKETTNKPKCIHCDPKHTVATEDQVVPECIPLEKTNCIKIKGDIEVKLQFCDDAVIDKDAKEDRDENFLTENVLIDQNDSRPVYELNTEDTSDTDDQMVPEDMTAKSNGLFKQKEVLVTEIEFNADIDSFYDKYEEDELHNDFFPQEDLLTLDHLNSPNEIMIPDFFGFDD